MAKSEQKSSLQESEPKINSVEAKASVIPVQKNPIPDKVEDSLIQWLIQWAAARPIELALESKHFFLEGMRLEELARCYW